MWNDQIDIYKHITMKHIPEVGPSTGFCEGFVRGGGVPVLRVCKGGSGVHNQPWICGKISDICNN